MIQHERFRRIIDWQASQALFKLLLTGDQQFKIQLMLGAMRNARRLNENGDGLLYLNVGHTGLQSSDFRRWVANHNVRPVYFVHDLIPIAYPEYCRPGEDTRHRERIQTVLQTGVGVIANSKQTLEQLGEFAQTSALNMPPSVAAWLGTNLLPRAAPYNTNNRALFVTLGTIEARKNHILLLRIWSRLIDKLGNNAPQLVIIGGRGWEAEPVFDALDRSNKLNGHVLELNRCSDQELATYFASAKALLFPSHAEGYGLPLVEALNSSVPVIASDLPVFREIGGDIPTYLPSDDEAAWEAAIVSYADPEKDDRAAQLERMSKFKAPSWKSHFEKVESFLRILD